MRFRNPFLDLYMEYVEETESPRLFHIFSALSGASASLGRRAFIDWGHKQFFPNMFIALVGPPGVRKGTAMGLMRGRLQKVTNVRFAPDDTGGQRQGLISAIMEDEPSEEEKEIVKALEDASEASLDMIDNFDINKLVDHRDKHVLYICASELNSLLGNDVLNMLPFMNKLYDGEDYTYRLKSSKNTLAEGLLSILGATTPQNIATAFPAEAVGQGFMSRVIFVFGNEKYKNLFPPPALDARLKELVEKEFEFLGREFEGEIKIEPRALQLLKHMYGEVPEIQDPRFVFYCERRHDHLMKIAMTLAAMRHSNEINMTDADEARAILKMAERLMPDALGEYGMNKLGAAKQKLVEFLRNTKQPITAHIIYAMMQRDMSLVDFKNSLAELCNSQKIMRVTTGGGEAYVYRNPKSEEAEELLSLLEDKSEEDTGTGED